MNVRSAVVRLAQLCSLALSAALIFWPAIAATPLKLAWALAGLVCGAIAILRFRKQGLLAISPARLFQRIREQGPPRSDPLETLAIALICIAALAMGLR